MQQQHLFLHDMKRGC